MPRKRKVSADEIPVSAADVTPIESPAADKPAKASRTSKKPKPSVEETVIVQFGGAEWDLSDLREKAITSYVAMGHRRGRIKKAVLYVKPEEHKVYYVFNDKETGSIDIV